MTRKETFNNAVKNAINGDKKHGWGVEDSLAVIKALCVDEMGESPDDEFFAYVKEVVNPSQFRQKLETAEILVKTESKRSKTLSILDKEYLSK